MLSHSIPVSTLSVLPVYTPQQWRLAPVRTTDSKLGQKSVISRGHWINSYQQQLQTDFHVYEPMRKLRFLALAFAGLWVTATLLCCGCGRFIPSQTANANGPTKQSVDVAGRSFSRAILLKPERIGGDMTDELAPLFIVEQPTNAVPIPRPQFRKDPITNAAREPFTPHVLQFVRTVDINGRQYFQCSYLWSGIESESSRHAPLQCVRMTLNKAGFPVVWEVLSESVRQKVFFVAESLEQAANREYGAPLSGRQFSIERSIQESPDTIVVKTLSDGPIPMGPFVYLEAQSKMVTTILCRCMPAQVEEISETRTYPMQSLSGENSRELATVLAVMGYDGRWARFVKRLVQADSFLGCLRFPHDF